MKKIIIKFLMATFVCCAFLGINVYAESLDNLQTSLDKETVHPDENVTATVQFGESLGSYTFDFAYDKNLLEFVSATGGETDDNGTRVRVYYFDTTGGNNPRKNMTITFKGKSGITTSNPTQINITAEGLANADASVQYNDIKTPITKQLIVEPVYEDYAIKLEYTGDIIKNTEKEMKLTISSSMGKAYEHVRLIAKATTPTGATVKLIGKDEKKLDQDLIQSGWGDDSGYEMGGKDVSQVLNLLGTFSSEGEYSINFRLVDRDDSDSVIVEKSFGFKVYEEPTIVPPEEEPPKQETPTEPEPTPEKQPEKAPTTLPKTGTDLYAISYCLLLTLVAGYMYVDRKMK